MVSGLRGEFDQPEAQQWSSSGAAVPRSTCHELVPWFAATENPETIRNRCDAHGAWGHILNTLLAVRNQRPSREGGGCDF